MQLPRLISYLCFNVLLDSSELVQCKFELNRGKGYVVEGYDSGNPLYTANDFILLKEKVSDDSDAVFLGGSKLL